MKNLYCFHVLSHISLDDAWKELESTGIELLYGSEEQEAKQLYGYAEGEINQSGLKSIFCIENAHLPPIDWEAQWAMQGWNYQNGLVHLNLKDFGYKDETILLQPGPGFGDLSHPTTRLMLHLMSAHIRDCCVLDIGCGSGVLSLAAVSMGASFAYGIDIDQLAIEHSIANAHLNHYEERCQFGYPADFKQPENSHPLVIVINMIISEQKEAIKVLEKLKIPPALYITSGVRKEEREEYLKQANKWSWQLLEEKCEADWMAFVFQRKGS